MPTIHRGALPNIVQTRRTVPIVFVALSLVVATVRAQEKTSISLIEELRREGVAGTRVACRGIVTAVERHHLFVQDETDAIEIQWWNADKTVHVGEVIIVRGELTGYGNGLQVRGEEVTKDGAAPLPEPEATTAESLVGGPAVCRRVILTGVVHDVVRVEDEVRLLIRSGAIPLIVTWHLPGTDLARPDELLDAIVEVTGVAHADGAVDSLFSGIRILLASPSDLHILRPGDANVFSRPKRTLRELRNDPSAQPERFRCHGTVTYASPVGWFYFQDATGTARAGKNPFLDAPEGNRRPLQSNPNLTAGDVVEVVGYAVQDVPEKTMPWMVQCEWRILRHEEPPPCEPVPSSSILAGDFDGRSVSVTGEVVDITVEKDRNGYFNHLLTINDDGVSFWALVQREAAETLPVKTGDFVRLDGVAMAFHDEAGDTERFRINLNDFDDMRPAISPLQSRHLVRWLLGGLAAILLAVGWIVVLRFQVRQQTARLLESQQELERFKTISETSTDFIGIATVENAPAPLYVNPAGRNLLGIPPELAPAEARFEDFFTREALERFANEGIPHALEHGHWRSEITMLHRDGHEIPVSFVGLIIKAPDGTPLYMSTIARDITETRDLENKLRESLEQERQLNQLKSSFVNTISHEFRTPLGIVLFASSMLRRFEARFNAEERAAQLDAIDQAVNRMNDLVEQSLTLGRAEAAEPRPAPVDTDTFCRHIVEEVLAATSHRCPIRLDIEDGLPGARSDDAMLRAILSNLLGNAVKYSPVGRPVTLTVRRRETEAIFTIRDRGPGITDEDLPKIFATFHRGAGTEGIPGTGLGLAIVQRCVDALDGRVAASNADGGGAEFTVELPRFFSS
ncbi:MAG: PAS domain S-box protein [Verrucomicrobiae bacterium]|nr:PAS domain S-box protein [Verrucomicrobiae bacterium]